MKILLLNIVFLFSFILSSGQTFTGPGGSIPGSSTTQKCFDVTVSGVGTINSTTLGLASVCFSITHPNVDELEILLKAPDGTTVPLSIQNGGTGNNYTNTCFTATAANSIKFGTAPFTGSFIPEGYLGSVNNGQNANGVWSICIQDRRNGGNSGTLSNNWSLTFNNTPAPLPPALPGCSTTLPATSSCATATVICDFNGLCGSTTGSSVQDWTNSGLDGCFGLQNNSFIKFIASASTASFTVWVPTNTGGIGGGIQMLFFSGTCNTGPVTTHGCYPHIFPYQSPSQPLPTIISATGLTPGNTYYLMTDGFNSDKCTFRIAANSGVNILNVNPIAPAICIGQNVNLTASGGNGTYSWAPALTLSANSGTTVTATPTITTTYTLSSLTSGGCPLTKDVTVVVNDTPVVTAHPAAAPQNVCLGGPVTALSVTATAGSGTISSYQWFISVTPSNAGGAAIPFATNSTYTPSSSSIGTLYFYCRVTNSNGCSTKSNVSGAIIVTANPGTPVASATFQPTCLVPTGTIVVTVPAGANIQYSIGGAYQASGTFTGLAPATYSITAKNTTTGCISPIRTVTINPITPAPVAPTATATTQPTCLVPFGSIGITAPLGGNYVYSVGSIFQSGTSFSGLGINTIYNVTVKDTLTGCISANTPVAINALPAGPPLPAATVTVQPTCIIPTGTISISAPSGANIQYSIGGAYQASNIFSGLTNGTSYSITAKDISTGCISNTLVVAVNTITGAPAAPTASVTSQPTCAIPTGTITISAPTGVNFEFSIGGIYQASNVFSGLTPGTSYAITTKDIITGCVSSPLNLTINAISGTPAPTVTTPVTYCLNATPSALTATGSNLLWYTVATGGTGSSTAPTPVTTATGSTIYYVSQNIATCEGPRAPITVTINSTPAPTVTTPVTYCLNATPSALTATGSNLLWYTVATGGTGSATAPTPVTTAAGSTIYYVSQNIATCEGPRAAITVTINSTPSPTVKTPVTYCLNATALTLSATGSNLLWYTVATGGTGSATAPTPVTTAAGSIVYYVSQNIATCEGPRAAITVTINSTPAPTVTTPVTYCLNATASALNATGSNLLWYTTATGGTGSATAPTPVTTAAGSTVYYVSQTIAICEGPRAAITVTINSTPAPIITTPVTYCQNAISTPLTATGSNLLWYTVATGGTGSSTAPTPITTAAGSTVYYVSQNIATCEGPRAAITVTINSTPAPTVTTPVTYCLNAAASALTATGSNLLWYTTATGGTGSSTAPTPVTTAAGSTVYYVSQNIATCEGPRAAITVTINSTPAPTVTTPVTYCQNAIATPLTATGSNLLWYTVATGGTGSASGPTPVTTAAGSTIYYVSQNIATCEGPRAAFTVTINATPALPTVTTPITYCLNTTAIPLTATGSNLLWYTVPTGGTGSAVAPTPVTTAAGSNIYYVSQTIATCVGPRTAITVTINSTPAPTVTTPVTYCQTATPSALTATGSNLLWFTVATGGTGSATAPTPVTTVAGSTFYYVSQTIATCEGPRAVITVTVNPTPALPTVTTPVVYCQNATASALTATGSNLLWYTVATGGTGSATAPTPLTNVAGAFKYFVSQTLLGCEGPRETINITINPTPALPVVTTPVVYCRNATAAALSATGSSLLWYTVATGSIGSAITPTPLTNVAGAFTYYVSQTLLGCEGPRETINITINPTPALPTITTPVFYCQNNTATALNAVGTNLLWYNTNSGGTGSSVTPIPGTVNTGNTFYFVSQTNSFGCESPRNAITVTVNPTVNSVTNFSYNPNTVCKNGINPGPVYGIGFTQGGLFLSSPGLSINAVNGNIDLSGSVAGNYTVKYVYNKQGCTLADSSTSTILINPAIATNTIFSYSSPICKNDPNPSPAFANGFTTGGQFASTTGLTVDALTGRVNLATSNPGIYQVTYTLPTLGCRQGTSNFSFISITANTLPVTSFNYSPAAVCPGDNNPVLNRVTGFTTGGNFKATPAGLNINAATGAIDVLTSAIGVYTITYSTLPLGCRLADSSRFTFIIRSATPPNTNFFYTTPVCKSDPVAMPLFGTNFTAGGVFSAPAGVSINSSNGYVNVPQSTAGVYQIKYKLTATACSLSDSSTTGLEIINLPSTPVISSIPVCGTGITALSAISNGSILWYSDAATNNLVNTGSSFTTNLTRNTRYYLTSTIGNCTTLPNPVDVVINPLPAKPALGNDTSICNGDVLVLNAGNYFGYLWQNISTQPTFSVNIAGTYSVQVSNAAGCTSADSITINILTNCDDIQFANAFSPNGDGYNDFFGPLGNLFLVNNYTFSIFNRYGELVFKSDNPNQKWDGTVKGKAYGNTSFVWVATYVYRGKIKKTQKGNVSLLK